MFYEHELHFFCDTLKKIHVRSLFVSPDDRADKIIDGALNIFFDDGKYSKITVNEIFGSIENNILYRYTFFHKICYIFMLLPDTEPKSVFVIGPFLSSPIPKSQVFEIGEKIGVSPKDQRILESIFSDIPVISTGSHFFAMLDAFGECIWGSATAFRELDVKRERTEPSFTVGSTKSMDEPDNLIVSMQMMEKRYHFENELMDAVALGQSRKVNMLLGAFSELSFERRSADPLRNAKNYCIITNTLLRKAAEKGGVHPLYLDGVSSSFATKIEQLPHASETKDLLVEMFTSYCRLVRKHSINSFSPTVQKTILLIESDLSADLSLSSLATAQNISPGYLSTIFKRETGKTITEYVIDKRIKLAARLLESTHLQVQTIALHCGIMDVQYFSKVFKKIMGKTPKEYRESVR